MTAPTKEHNLPEPGSTEYTDLAHTGSAPALPVDPTTAVAPPQAPAEVDVDQAAGSLELFSAARPEQSDVAARGWLPRRAPLPGVDSGLGLKKFRDRLVTVPVIRAWRRPEDSPVRVRAEIAPVRFHADLPLSEAWTYEGSLPGPTIEVRRDRPVRIDWENGLMRDGQPVHLPFDVVRVPPSTAGPPDFAAGTAPGGRSTTLGPGADSYPPLQHTDELTAATVVHLYGALTDGHNDGWAHNVTLPGGVIRCTSPNRQAATTLWYHDHAMAVTRFNLFAGLAGFYIIRDAQEAALRLPSGKRELLLNSSNSRVMRLALHDTTEEQFTAGTAVLPADAAFSQNRRADALTVIGTDGGLLPAPYTPADGVLEMGPGERVDVLVNFAALRGRTLELRNENGTALNAQPGQADASVMQFRVGGREVRDRFTLPPALSKTYTRYEHTADGRLVVGDRVIESHEHAWVAVIPTNVRGAVHPELWELRQLAADEDPGAVDAVRLTQRDGSVFTFKPAAKLFDDAVTIRLSEGDRAVWNIVHLGGPDHPMHIHMTEFQMLTRRSWTGPDGSPVPGFGFDLATGATPQPLPFPADGRAIDPVAAGMKGTWVVKAREWVQVLGDFSGATGSFMYHCHIRGPRGPHHDAPVHGAAPQRHGTPRRARG